MLVKGDGRQILDYTCTQPDTHTGRQTKPASVGFGSNSKVSSGRHSLSSIAELIVRSDRFDSGTRSVPSLKLKLKRDRE